MKILLLLATAASLGATAAFADDFDDVLRTFFSYLDKDGDDAVSVEELTTLADELNLRTYLNDKSIKSLFNRLDTNQDRHISYEDFDGLIGLFLNRIFQGVLSTGRSVDRDNNGQLSLGEAKEALTSGTVTVNDRRVSNGKLTGKLDAEWPKLMRSFDKNNDDEISLDEVKDAVKDVVEEAIRTVDTDRDEKMSLEELKNIVDPDTLPDTVMKIIDEDGDGQFSYAEFKKEAENRNPHRIYRVTWLPRPTAAAAEPRWSGRPT